MAMPCSWVKPKNEGAAGEWMMRAALAVTAFATTLHRNHARRFINLVNWRLIIAQNSPTSLPRVASPISP